MAKVVAEDCTGRRLMSKYNAGSAPIRCEAWRLPSIAACRAQSFRLADCIVLSCFGLWGILSCKRAKINAAEWHIALCLSLHLSWSTLKCKLVVLKAADWHIVLCLICLVCGAYSIASILDVFPGLMAFYQNMVDSLWSELLHHEHWRYFLRGIRNVVHSPCAPRGAACSAIQYQDYPVGKDYIMERNVLLYLVGRDDSIAQTRNFRSHSESGLHRRKHLHHWAQGSPLPYGSRRFSAQTRNFRSWITPSSRAMCRWWQ